jgi:hypothetical protein
MSMGEQRLDSPAAHPAGGDRGGYHRGLGDRRPTGGDGSGYYGGLSDRGADDADSSDACWPEWHCQSPAVVVIWSASIEAMIA